MTNRVLLDTTNGLKISKPGYDVLTCGPEGLIFSSLLASQSFLMSGQVNPAMGEIVTVNFGVTYSTQPVVLMIGTRADGARWYVGVSTMPIAGVIYTENSKITFNRYDDGQNTPVYPLKYYVVKGVM